MIDAKFVSEIVQKFPDILRNPDQLKSEAYKVLSSELTRRTNGQIPGLPSSLSGVKSVGLQLAKAELKRRVGNRLDFLKDLI